MKNLVFGVMAGTMLTLVIMILLSVYTRDVRKNELEHAMEEAMIETMQYYAEESGETQKSEDYLKHLQEGIVSRIQAKSELTIHVIEADWQKGLLSVEGVERFDYPIGNKGSVSCVRTLLLDQKADEEAV